MKNCKLEGWILVMAISTPYLVLTLAIFTIELDQTGLIENIKNCIDILGGGVSILGLYLAYKAYRSWKEQLHYSFVFNEQLRFREKISDLDSSIRCIINNSISILMLKTGQGSEEERKIGIAEYERRALKKAEEGISLVWELEDFRFKLPIKYPKETREKVREVRSDIIHLFNKVKDDKGHHINGDEAEKAIQLLKDIDHTLLQLKE